MFSTGLIGVKEIHLVQFSIEKRNFQIGRNINKVLLK